MQLIKPFCTLIICFMLANNTTFAQVLKIGDTFPKIEAKTLAGNKITFPDDVLGSPSVLVVAFDRGAQSTINPWTAFMKKKYPKIAYYEIPIIRGMWSVFSNMIDKGMRSGVPKELHSKTATYYGSKMSDYKKLFGAKKENDCYVSVLDAKGKIIYRAVGSLTDQNKIALDKLLATKH